MKKFIILLLIVSVLLLGYLLFKPTPSALEFRDVNKRSAAAVGIAPFGLLHPKFPVSRLIRILKKVKREDVAVSFPYGTFGSSPRNYRRVALEMRKANKNLHTVIYGICGPCRIPRRDGRLEIFYPRLSINNLNNKLVRDRRVREDYRKLVLKIKRNFIDPYPDQTFDFIPELEDNQTSRSFGILFNIAAQVFKDNPNVRIVANPVSNRRRSKLPVEVHTNSELAPLRLKAGDIINLDGHPFLFKGEQRKDREVSFDSVKRLIKRANRRKVDVYLWRGEWQGLPNTRSRVILGRERDYRITNDSQIVELLNLK